MEENKEELIDQKQLAEDIASKIKYTFLDFFLVKPLDPIKVKKEFSVPVDTTVKKDENGIEAQDFKEVSTEVKEVDSDFRQGVVVKVPMYYNDREEKDKHVNVGDIVVFKDTAGQWFDLVKNTRLLREYDILGVVK